MNSVTPRELAASALACAVEQAEKCHVLSYVLVNQLDDGRVTHADLRAVQAAQCVQEQLEVITRARSPNGDHEFTALPIGNGFPCRVSVNDDQVTFVVRKHGRPEPTTEFRAKVNANAARRASALRNLAEAVDQKLAMQNGILTALHRGKDVVANWFDGIVNALA